MIYFFRHHDLVKIGRTAMLHHRRLVIQKQVGFPLEIARVVDAPNWAERWFHRTFADFHLTGEWFVFSKKMLTTECPPDGIGFAYEKKRTQGGSLRG